VRRTLLPLLALLAVSACARPSLPSTDALLGVTHVSAHTVCDEFSYSVPAQVGGYSVEPEPKVARQFCGGGQDALITGGALFGFRQDGVLYGTLQVSPFKRSVRSDAPAVQQEVVGQIITSVPRQRRFGTQLVYVGTGNRSVVFVWFRDRLLHVLLTHDVKDPEPLVTQLVGLT
jgi:hypothetical protein